ncbi:MAG: ABC transporter ATP-binding protein [Alphaproteobacteria bacterium]|nr:ABC transporter ATP-binding protein [Alphaproteobacteria bacterium]
MAGVRLEGVTKRFGDTLAVDRLSLEIRDGEFVVLLGPSGCGKTTTLNMIAGLEVPSEGHIMLDGRRIEGVPPDKRDIAMVFQSIALYPHMTVAQNIAFPLRMARMARPEIDKRVDDVARLLHIGELLGRHVHELSGGQRQRVALGRAVVRRPAVFLFDEPLSSLDAKLRVEMRIEIKKLHERLGSTFIYVTHDQVEALTMADRIAVMDAGIVQQYGSPDEVYGRPSNTMVAHFLGDPGMNFVAGRIAERNGSRGFEAAAFFLPLPEGVIEGSGAGAIKTLGIRAENVRTELGGAGTAGVIEGRVFATEPVGSDLFLDIAFGDSDEAARRLFKVRARPELSVRVGDTVPLGLPADKLYLFDDAGRRVYPR